MREAAIEGEIRPTTITPPSARGRFLRPILRVLGSLGLVLSPLIVACTPDSRAGGTSPTQQASQEVQQPNSTVTAPSERGKTVEFPAAIPPLPLEAKAIPPQEPIAAGGDNPPKPESTVTPPKEDKPPAEAQKPPEEKDKVETCGFLPSKYSGLLKPNYIEYSNGERRLTGLVARLPAETPIIVVQAGEAAKSPLSKTKIQITVSNPDDPTMTTQIISGNIKPKNMLVEKVAVGEKLGYIDTEPEDPNATNFSVTFSKYDPATKTFSTPIELLEQNCLGVMSRPPRIVKVNFLPENAPQITAINNAYRN